MSTLTANDLLNVDLNAGKSIAQQLGYNDSLANFNWVSELDRLMRDTNKAISACSTEEAQKIAIKFDREDQRFFCCEDRLEELMGYDEYWDWRDEH